MPCAPSTPPPQLRKENTRISSCHEQCVQKHTLDTCFYYYFFRLLSFPSLCQRKKWSNNSLCTWAQVADCLHSPFPLKVAPPTPAADVI